MEQVHNSLWSKYTTHGGASTLLMVDPVHYSWWIQYTIHDEASTLLMVDPLEPHMAHSTP
jgi:hypothetical protein